jgi:hypothetical protein
MLSKAQGQESTCLWALPYTKAQARMSCDGLHLMCVHFDFKTYVRAIGLPLLTYFYGVAQYLIVPNPTPQFGIIRPLQQIETVCL